MIEVIEGHGLGSGKSYYVLTRLFDHFLAGGTAYITDTFKVKWAECKALAEKRYGLVLQDQQCVNIPQASILALYEHTVGGDDDLSVVIVLDEVQDALNARDWNDKRKRSLFDWCCQSRHDCNDIWVISQSQWNVDKQLRRLATYTRKVRNSRFWSSNIITKWLTLVKWASFGLHPGAYFIVKTFDSDGKTQLGKNKWLEHDRELFNCYVSRSMAGARKRAGLSRSRVRLDKVQSKRPWVRWVAGPIVLSLLVSGCTLVRHVWFPGKKVKDEGKGELVSAASAKAAPSVRSASYAIETEEFRGLYAPGWIVTSERGYQVGEMSALGLVEGVRAGVIRIRKPDGGLLYVVTDFNGAKAQGQEVRERTIVSAIAETAKAGKNEERTKVEGVNGGSPSPSPYKPRVFHRRTQPGKSNWEPMNSGDAPN